MTIKYCTNSTITEAWALILGMPAPLDDTDAAVVHRAAKEKIGGLRSKPAVVLVNVKSDVAAPFWKEQVTWDDEKYLVRFGHRYLSVHFIQKGDRRYETFDVSLKPTLDQWMDLYADTLTRGADKHSVDRVGFGYVNTFRFGEKDFDLSRFFKVDFGLDVGIPNAELARLEMSSVLYDKDHDVHLAVNLSAEGPDDKNEQIRVVTKVFAEKRGLENTSFADRDRLRARLTETKEAAKGTFFNFVTDETQKIMGAVADAKA